MARGDRLQVRRGFNATKAPAAIAAAALTLAACADLKAATHFQPLPVNPASPVAGAVEAASRVDAPIPSFASIPPKPTDIRPAAVYKTEVSSVVGDRRDMNHWIAANPAGVANTEAWAAKERARVAGQAAPSAKEQADSEVFAKKLRQAVTAPPSTAPN